MSRHAKILIVQSCTSMNGVHLENIDDREFKSSHLCSSILYLSLHMHMILCLPKQFVLGLTFVSVYLIDIFFPFTAANGNAV